MCVYMHVGADQKLLTQSYALEHPIIDNQIVLHIQKIVYTTATATTTATSEKSNKTKDLYCNLVWGDNDAQLQTNVLYNSGIYTYIIYIYHYLSIYLFLLSMTD